MTDRWATLDISDTSLDDRLVYVLQQDEHFAKRMMSNLDSYGYISQHFNDFKELEKSLTMDTPCSMIIDVMASQGDVAGTEIIFALRQKYALTCPIIFTSAQDDLFTRLQAVRSGGDAYFTEPFEIEELIGKMESLKHHQISDEHRILIIGENSNLNEEYALILEEAGLQAGICPPAQIIHELINFKPDLILMDIDMAEFDGYELAAVIRQQNTFIGIPIIFLSVNDEFERRLAAVSIGVDDYLTTPIQPDHLIGIILTRIQRSLDLLALVKSDPLTGLLNYTAIKKQLEVEVSRARRQKTNLVCAMVDIDHFKLLNDTYGHSIGDRIIQKLGRVLQKRLRRTDVVGRYTSEKFMTLLLNTDGAVAAEVFEDVRYNFSMSPQKFDALNPFFVTFSCGIATLSECVTPLVLMERAEQALYKAKEQGRNQVVYLAETDDV